VKTDIDMRVASVLPLLLGTAIFSSTSCRLSLSERGQQADVAVHVFHRLFNSGQFAQIYSDATPELRSSDSERDFATLLEAIHTKLGDFDNASGYHWRLNVTGGATFIELTYQSHFRQGSGVETFTFRMSGDDALLYGYNISSLDLVLK